MCWGAGHLVNINDISGPYSGIVFGISNTIATLPGIISPFLVGIITAEVLIFINCVFDSNLLRSKFLIMFRQRQTQSEWKIVFAICAAISFFGGVVYLIFSDAKPQSWALSKNSKTNEDSLKDINLDKIDDQVFEKLIK